MLFLKFTILDTKLLNLFDSLQTQYTCSRYEDKESPSGNFSQGSLNMHLATNTYVMNFKVVLFTVFLTAYYTKASAKTKTK